MKICVIQPYYSFKSEDRLTCFHEMVKWIDACDESMDVIVLPEYCDIPAATKNAREFNDSMEELEPVIREKVVQTARRCQAVVFANFGCPGERGRRNTTFVFDRDGREIGAYFKAHPAPSEEKTIAQGGNGMDCSYSYEYREPYVVEIGGVRYGFMTCYDFYFYEAYPTLARQKVDVVIGCSHQRTDTHDALEIFGRFLAYNTNAYLVRAAVSLGETSDVCGCSMIVAPDGTMLKNMKNEVGLCVCDIDPKKKYYKPAGFRGKSASHFAYTEVGRRPWLYRPAGSMMVPPDEKMPFPRVCAQGGFSGAAPEDSLPAFASAIALGAQEIGLDLWQTRDGVLVCLPDASLARVCAQGGFVWEKTYCELLEYDFGLDPAFAGLKVARFEEVLRRFSCTVVMDIHVRFWEEGDSSDPQYEKIAALLRQYDCEKHCCITSARDECLASLHAVAPEIRRCLAGKDDARALVRRAVALGAEKVRLNRSRFDPSAIEEAHENGIRCAVCGADDPREACDLFRQGADTVLTRNSFALTQACAKQEKR